MTSEETILEAVNKKFPTQKDAITSLYKDSEDFREVCEDYVICLNSMLKIVCSDVMRDKYRQDFEVALKELEVEILAFLGDSMTDESTDDDK